VFTCYVICYSGSFPCCSTVAETVRRVLRKLMTTAVAVQMNWKGTRGKLGLSTLELKNVIFGKH